MPEDVVTPVVICPTCGELIAVRDEPQPLEIPQRPEQSEAVTSQRPPDQHDVLNQPTSYRSPRDPVPVDPQPRSPNPEQGLRVFVLTLVGIVLPAVLVGFVLLSVTPGVNPLGMAILGSLLTPLVVLSLLLFAAWGLKEPTKDDPVIGWCLAGCIWIAGGLIILTVASMVLVVVVCCVP
jgi:hypothetical protein